MQYPLNKKIEIGDKTLDSVEIKESWNAGDFIEIQDAGNSEGMRCCRQVALAIDQPDPVVRKLSIPDYTEILRISSDFFTKNINEAKANT